MDEATRNAWCRERGVYPTELETWKQDALSGLGEPQDPDATAKHDRRRIKELERQLQRKDKALAETAALLVLSKNPAWIAAPPVAVETDCAILSERGAAEHFLVD
jgi:hypothetical protein